jgi:hypothetical protein
VFFVVQFEVGSTAKTPTRQRHSGYALGLGAGSTMPSSLRVMAMVMARCVAMGQAQLVAQATERTTTRM